MKKHFLWMSIFATWSLVSCGTQQPQSKVQGTEQSSQFAEINNDFSFRFWNALTAKNEFRGTNNFVSPTSISTAFAMAYLGANGETAKGMAVSLGIPSDLSSQAVCQAFREFKDQATASGDQDKYEFSSVNKFWSQTGFGWLESYKDTLSDCFDSSIAEYDFRQEGERARAVSDINRWASDNTHEKIKNVVTDKDITPDTRFAITNAVYFLGDWLNPFPMDEKLGLPKRDWHQENGKVVSREMMQQKDRFPYAETHALQALELPYLGKNGKSFSMVLLLPKDGDVSAMWQGIDANSYKDLVKSLSYSEVNVIMPTFKVENTFKLGKFFSEDFGMNLAFSDYADFSRMNGRRDIKLDEVIHKTFIKADNKGTEAAAVTVIIGAEIASAPINLPVNFIADRPFGFVIKDNQSNAIVFMGSIFDPSK